MCVTHLALEKRKNKRKIELEPSEEKRPKPQQDDSESDDTAATKPANLFDYLRDPKTRDLLDSSDPLDEIIINMMDTYEKGDSGSSGDAAAATSAIKLDYDYDLKYCFFLEGSWDHQYSDHDLTKKKIFFGFFK